MLRFPVINRSINRHQCKLLWLKSPPRKGRMDTGAGAEIKGSERSHWKAPLGSLAWKGSFLIAPGAPGSPWAPAAPSSAGGSWASPWLWSLRCWTWRQVHWAGRASWSVTGSSVVPSRSLGHKKGRFEHLVELEPLDSVSQKCWVCEFLVSHRVAMVMIIILQGWRTSPSLSSGKVIIWWAWGCCRCQAVSAFLQLFPASSFK